MKYAYRLRPGHPQIADGPTVTKDGTRITTVVRADGSRFTVTVPPGAMGSGIVSEWTEDSWIEDR